MQVVLVLLGYLTAIGLVLVGRTRWAAYAAAGLVSATAALAVHVALQFLPAAPTWSVAVDHWLPQVAVRVAIDPLSAYFLLVLSLVALAISLFTIGDLQHLAPPRARAVVALLAASLLGGTVVLIAADILSLLTGFAVVTVTLGLLVGQGHERREARHAARALAIRLHLGGTSIVAAALVLFHWAESLDFGSIREAAADVPEGVRASVLVLSLLGFSARAGLVPFNTRLPQAYKVVPGVGAALLSAITLTVPVYGLLRVCLDLLPTAPAWWGYAVAGVGLVSAPIAMFLAVQDRNIGHAAAHVTTASAGLVFAGIGTLTVFRAHGLPEGAALATAATAYLVIGHGVHTAVLALAAGAVDRAAGTLVLDQLGGLAKRMPFTAVCFLVGGLALAALPPLSGFTGYWLQVQSLLAGFQLTGGGARLGFPSAAVLLGATAAMAGMATVRAYGIAFLGIPRSSVVRDAGECSWWNRLGLAALAAACVMVALVPGLVLSSLGGLSEVLRTSAPGVARSPWTVNASAPAPVASVAPLALCAALVALAAVITILQRSLPGWRRWGHRRGEPWIDGLPALTPTMQISGQGYSRALQLLLLRFRPAGWSATVPEGSSALAAVAGSDRARPERTEAPDGAELPGGIARLGRAIDGGSLWVCLAYVLGVLMVALMVMP